jgi:hypothetical protein
MVPPTRRSRQSEVVKACDSQTQRCRRPAAASARAASIGYPIRSPFGHGAGALALRRLGSRMGKGPFPPPALPGFSGTTNLSATPGRPACPSRASSWSSLTTPRGFPCCVHFPCVHAVANTPAQRLSVLLCSLHPAVSAFPEMAVGSACASSFSRLARRSLALRPAHSRCHRIS